MNEQNSWQHTDVYLEDLYNTPNKLQQLEENCQAAGMRPIQVSAMQGKMMMQLAKIIGAKRVLELGTLGGYSTAWLAWGVGEDGHIDTLEISPENAVVAQQNLANLGLDKRIDIHIGKALDVLPTLSAGYDLIFIDADKGNYPDYYKQARRLCRVGGLIIVDNVVRHGAVANKEKSNPMLEGIRQCHQLMAADKGVDVSALQTVGSKGHDGFALVRVTASI